MPPGLTVFEIFSVDKVSAVLDLIGNIEDERWITRTELSAGRGINGAKCHYDFCGHSQMDLKTRNSLKKTAPSFENFSLAEVCVNRYKVGDFIGEHRDRHIYRRNLVISLQQLGDGLLINESNTFIEDKLGQCVMFEGIGPSHSVPTVKNNRYSLIYLYE
jgi:hypothetical protein